MRPHPARFLLVAVVIVLIGFALAELVAATAGAEPAPPPGRRRVRELVPRVVDLQPRVLDVAPRVKPLPHASQLTVPSDVLFAFDRADLSPVAQQILADVVTWLGQAPAGTVVVTGYTDSIGDTAYNLQLSGRRAVSVRDYLTARVKKPGFTYQVVGKGEAEPVAPNSKPDGSDNPEGRQQNRRVVITIPN